MDFFFFVTSTSGATVTSPLPSCCWTSGTKAWASSRPRLKTNSPAVTDIILLLLACNLRTHYSLLKGQCHKIFCFWFFSWISFPQAPEYPIRIISNFFENSLRYSQVKVHHWFQRHRWQICHRCQWHRQQILAPISLVLLIPVANNGNNIWLLRPYRELEAKMYL